MFKQLFGGVQEAVERLQGGGTDSTRDVRSTDVAAGRAAAKKESGVISDIDKRAQSGDVSFEDFLKIGRTFKQFKGKVPGMPGTLTDDQVADTLKKFEIHEKIVNAMTDAERADPQIMLDDVENTDENCPLIQRRAAAGGVRDCVRAARWRARRRLIAPPTPRSYAAGKGRNEQTPGVSRSVSSIQPYLRAPRARAACIRCQVGGGRA